MKVTEFLKQIDESKMIAAIQAAEKESSAELRVFLTKKSTADASADARIEFHKLGMHKTKLRNGVLILVAPKSQNFAIVGDEGIHKKCGQEFWQATALQMETYFKRQEFEQGILLGIKLLGETLARHFPRQADDRNELSDSIARD
jgi:uncharacterized membrane protein